ncbi:hypothetical protein Y032_0120g931 [Ancylostoma ceylanicum]|uniref:CCHC-type domain-containing protein n=1 Tax=Ancylostoma ceylanicum TaxID=53326 RepID=A0A016TAR6_9BILA|nr:hypothetical protein Y032_0120g931 [Ancylostoma ceylanicum]
MGPVKRSRTQYNEPMAVAATPVSMPDQVTAPLVGALADLDDASTVYGKDAKELRDAATEALVNVWRDARQSTSQLAQQFNQCNSTLLSGLNESFAAVSSLIEALPVVASCSPDGQIPKIQSFSGSGENVAQFSIWLRRLEDIIRMRGVPMSSEQKANFLIGYLDGVAREKIEELSEDDKKSFDAIVSHLRGFFESPQQRHVARQALAACTQEPGETSTIFANRLLNLVRAATAEQDPLTQKERVLEEFVARLRSDIRYFVKPYNPATFEQAVTKAQTVEQLLSEAASERLMNSARVPQAVAVSSMADSPYRNRGGGRDQYARREPKTFSTSRARFQGTSTRRTPQPRDPRPKANSPCYNCGGIGHLARSCSSARRPSQAGGRSNFRDDYTIRNRIPSRSHSSMNPPSRARLLNVSPGEGDLEDARRQIEVLSLTLRENQIALANSNARTSALVKRNDELARTAFANTSPTRRSPSAHLPGVHSLLLCLSDLGDLLPTCLVMPSCSSQPAWLCPRQSKDALSRIPLSYNCSHLIPEVANPPVATTIHLYRPNSRRYDTPATLCKIVEHSVIFSVNLFGARREKHSESTKTVTVEHCRQMKLHHKCEHGDMNSVGDNYKTGNDLSFEWPSAPFGCCSEHQVTVVNCYLVSTVIHARHGAGSPDAAIGDIRHCAYRDGVCTLHDGSVLLWTPAQEEICVYIPVSKMKGHLLGHVWISDSKEFALSWREDSPRVVDCGNPLIISDQGYALTTIRRSPRSSDSIIGVVTSNQLAAQLLAVEDSVQNSVTALFRHASAPLCDRTNMLAFSLHYSVKLDPTYTLRKLLNRPNVAATYLGDGLVQIHNCIRIPPANYRILPFNRTCYTKPRADVVLSSQGQA